jgi:hypothetical protein
MDLNTFVIGILGIGIGLLLIVYSYYLNHQVYFLDFIESRFGSGTGTLAYRFIGACICMLSVFIMFGIVKVSNNSDTSNISPINSKQNNNQNQLPTGTKYQDSPIAK